ncbi:3-oxoacyl-ACP synthase III family protein [Streptomyces sp. YGL11-2]|uniref:3-oxoacyl-ACP synthase III family protein n=1 Tax=Streptomyces sp. YGL11-2 TaxID=3414028 RepID=UPI003CF51545
MSINDHPARPIGVLGMGTFLPSRRRPNDEVASGAGVTADWITQRTGVRNRHVAAPHEAASDLAACAVRAAVAAAGLDIDQIDLLVLATSTPDELGPSTACRVQALTKARNAVALDVSAACSGWLFAARVAHDWLRADPCARYAAVVGVEAYSKFLDPADRATAVLFADGAAASVLGPVPPGQGFGDFHLGSDGTLADRVLIPAGGSRRPASSTTLRTGAHTIHMDGRAVRDFITTMFPLVVRDSLARNRLRLQDIDAFITHQPNPKLLRTVATDLGIPVDRLPIVAQEIGNIGAASTPYALATAAANGLLTPRSRILTATFGAGMTWGSALLTWSGAPTIRIAPQRAAVHEGTLHHAHH